MKNQNYEYNSQMREISGFGGGYEDACRKMVIAGLQYKDRHPNAKISYKTLKNVMGLTSDESNGCKKMQEEMLKAAGGDCTGAMMQACLGHIMFILQNGWDKYVQEMTKGSAE